NLSNYGDYFQQAIDGTLANECQVMLDLLTTNETYLFREPAHFEFLREGILASWKRGRLFRAWSAACSSGEEAYSLAMVAADSLGEMPWEIFGSDISTRVLVTARKGQYSRERTQYFPKAYLQKYCLKGVRAQSGTLLIDKRLRQRVQFQHINLNAPLPEDMGQFDVIFLRNVLIYFDTPTRQEIVKRLLSRLRPGGYFFVSHTETITGISNQLESAAPSVHRKKW
ncbi:MAG TPA: protein-glutamate O-methyltransferase CheR, partial [Acidiferrobacteraceae bacterium]|nr:protein-glutamate O-methyltransferase CheR [Acidiferrobacteraceae bacterium]